MNILSLLFISVLVQVVLFVPAYKYKTDKLTDLSYSLTFVLLALISFLGNDYHFLKLALLLMVIVWGARLGTYLFIRINKTKKDSRFDRIRIDFKKFFGFWVFQGLTVFVVLLPTFFFFQSMPMATFSVFLGFILWFAGLIIEGLADWQKFRFINEPKNKGKWVNVGLWKISRHPNYLGEILCWVGIYLFAFNAMSITNRVLGTLSPLTIIILLLFVSGIPMLEKRAEEKWGKNKDYLRYKKETALLVPFLY